MPLIADRHDACILRAIQFRTEHRMPECLEAIGHALELNPKSARARYELAFAQLLTGNYRDGFRSYESRWEAAGVPRPIETDRALLGPEWRGESLRGKRILLHAEQGFGDTIQFIRYAPLVAAVGDDVTLEVQPQLRDLARCVDSGCTIGTGTPSRRYDFHCSLMDLPRVFGTTLESVPKPTRIVVPIGKKEEWATRIGRKHGTNIGLVWGGNPNNSIDKTRSVPLNLLEPILTSTPNARFFSFQHGPAARQLADVPPVITDLRPQLHTFLDTAAALLQMDHVLTVDTAVAHLAGSLGLRAWLLTSYSPCWRWLLDTPLSPWYPFMRLFRQTTPGNWSSVITDIQKELYNTKQ